MQRTCRKIDLEFFKNCILLITKVKLFQGTIGRDSDFMVLFYIIFTLGFANIWFIIVVASVWV